MTVEWFPKVIPFPKVTTDDYLQQTAEDMLVLLQHTNKQQMPTLTFGSNITNTYIHITQILRQATARPKPLPQPAAAPTTTPNLTQPIPAAEPRVVLPTPAAEPRVVLPTPMPIQAPSVPPTKKVRAAISKPTRYGPAPRLRPQH